MLIANLLVGLSLLILGKKLFWLFVGAIGFMGASHMTARYFSGLPGWQILIIAVAAGLLGALLAVFFQKAAILLVGFYTGGYLVVSLLNTLNMATPALPWTPFVIGGLLGAALLYLLFDWTLIILSSLAGAAFISQNIQIGDVSPAAILAALFLAGVIIQGNMLKKRRG